MSYTPVELRHVRVGRSLFGYNRAMVEQIIEEVAQSFEATWRERGELIERVEAQDKQLLELRQREELLTHTLVAAEQAAADVRDRARRDAETIVSEARNEAREVGRAARAEHARLLAEAQKIEAMLRGALGVIAQAGDSVPLMSVQEPSRSLEAVSLPELLQEAFGEPAPRADPVSPPAVADDAPATVAVPDAAVPDVEVPWIREDTREFEPIVSQEPAAPEPVAEEPQPAAEETEPAAEAPEPAGEAPELLERLRLDKLPEAEPRREPRPTPASRDFDWGE